MLEPGQLCDRLIAAYPEVGHARASINALIARSPNVATSACLDDVLLAWAAGLGAPEAQAALERGSLAEAASHLERRGFPAWLIAEALQQTRIALLVATGDVPAICLYAGRGPLTMFVRVVASRNAVRLLPRAGRDVAIEDQILAAPTDEDPELAHIRVRCSNDIRAAVVAAWANLPKHERFVLSLQLHGQFSLAEIATLYKVHRVSAARKVAQARAALLAGTRQQLREMFGGAESTIDSMLRLFSIPVSAGDLPPTTGVGPRT